MNEQCAMRTKWREKKISFENRREECGSLGRRGGEIGHVTSTEKCKIVNSGKQSLEMRKRQEITQFF